MTASPDFFVLTLGDPCGIGPEIAATFLHTAPETWKEKLIIIGPLRILQKSAKQLGHLPLVPCQPFFPQPGKIMGIDTGNADSCPPGKICREGGAVALKALEIAHDLCHTGKCRGMITGPIGKKAIRLAGSPFSGHTDMLESWTGASTTRMAMVHGRLRVVMTTLHVPYRSVPALLSRESVFETIRLAHEAFRSPSRPLPRIAVAGLNPHAGEDGLFGDEETKAIHPAIAEFKKINPHVSGPFPADSMYKVEIRRVTDVFVAHTHDQGLIAIKTLGGLTCVNVTLGLPYIRTSVGHGTAYDIAGQGIADAGGLVAACREAFRLARKPPVDR